MSPISEMISFGAGVNSVAMTIMLVEDGWRGPIVFADTGGEHPDTYCYMTYFEKEYLKPRGLVITRLMPGSEYHSKKAQLPLEEYCLQCGIIPLLAVRWCSIEWKRDPVNRWSKDQGQEINLLGISASEPQRERDDPTVRYPLIDESIHRPECRRIIQKAGLLVPRKSGCFFCGGQSYAQWRLLYFEYPELYERAIAMEDNASEYNRKCATLDPHGISLRQHVERRWQDQMQMDLSQWLPCACRL